MIELTEHGRTVLARAAEGAVMTTVVRLADARVTAVGLGSFTAPYDMLDGITAAEAIGILSSRGRPTDGVVHAHAFVIELAGRTVMIDAGMGAASPLPGLMAGLAEAGIEQNAVDSVLLTHLHPDHANGLLDGEFAGAQVVVPDAEIAFARESDAIEAAGPFVQRDYARAGAVLEMIGPRLIPLSAWEAVAGLRPESLPGHSPGHTGYRLVDQGQEVLFIGDLIHFPDLQMHRPDVSVRPDIDPRRAAHTRRRVLDEAADRGLILAGAHLGAHPLRRVHHDGEDSFRSEPVPADPR